MFRQCELGQRRAGSQKTQASHGLDLLNAADYTGKVSEILFYFFAVGPRFFGDAVA